MKEDGQTATDPPQQISADEALKRMKAFAERKEKFIAAVKESKDQDIPTGTRPE